MHRLVNAAGKTLTLFWLAMVLFDVLHWLEVISYFSLYEGRGLASSCSFALGQTARVCAMPLRLELKHRSTRHNVAGAFPYLGVGV